MWSTDQICDNPWHDERSTTSSTLTFSADLPHPIPPSPPLSIHDLQATAILEAQAVSKQKADPHA